MDYPEDSDHAFIIRIWRENREIQDAEPTWRGVIEHVPTGKKRYLHDLAHIITFLNLYLVKMGVKTSYFWRWAVWIRGLKFYLKRPIALKPSARGSGNSDSGDVVP